VLRGHPAQRLLDLADHAQLIVVGSRGFGSVTGTLLGSTSRAVMTYALCPVLVARTGDLRTATRGPTMTKENS